MEDISAPTGDPVAVEFPIVADPELSIIVLAWRLTDGLVDCLRSVAATEAAPSFEVCVVLNGATPEVRTTVAAVKNARIVDLPVNAGFGGGCNAGASHAAGRSLVFLNDDAIVSPHWLRALSDQSAEHPDSLMASVLLNSDGTVQEAGSRVLSDAGTVQLGSGLSYREAEAAGVLSSRSIDYGSGAALLVPRAIWDELGGFDLLFEPAYFEDVDLSLRARLAGHDVRLAPAALVVHASGGSTFKEHRFRQFAGDRSGGNFVNRWRAMLEQAPAPDAPLSSLCDPRLVGTLPTPKADPRTAAERALDTSREYAAWLNAKLDVAEAAAATAQAAHEADVAELQRVQERANLLQGRIMDLESRGLLGVARWQIGLLLSRERPRKREFR